MQPATKHFRTTRTVVLDSSLIALCFAIIGITMHYDWLSIPDWQRMWIISVTVYGTCKALTLTHLSYQMKMETCCNYLFLEPGLNAKRYVSSHLNPPVSSGWLKGIGFTIAGAIFFWSLPQLLLQSSPSLAATAGMIGLVFILHFGLLELLSKLQRARGFRSTSLMNDPWKARGVAEFWSRWNTGFRDFSREMIFYPLVKRKLAHLGLWATFLFSGLVHDLVVSLPARGGYGGPTLYFLIQAFALDFERSRWGKKLHLTTGRYGLLWTLFVILSPVTLLFHRPFRENIVLPMLYDLGVIS